MLGETTGTKPDDSLLSADIKGIVSADAYALSVDNQAAGNTALVSHIELPTTAWVAITEDVNGGLGYILGAQRLPAGVHANITVQLLRATVPVNPYHAVIYADDGDGIFDFKSDTLVTTDAGDILMSNFATVN